MRVEAERGPGVGDGGVGRALADVWAMGVGVGARARGGRREAMRPGVDVGGSHSQGQASSGQGVGPPGGSRRAPPEGRPLEKGVPETLSRTLT